MLRVSEKQKWVKRIRSNGFTMSNVCISLISEAKRARVQVGGQRKTSEKRKRKERVRSVCLAAILGFLSVSTIMTDLEFPEKGRMRHSNQNSHFHGSPTTSSERNAISFPTRNRKNSFPETLLEIDSRVFGPRSLNTSIKQRPVHILKIDIHRAYNN